MTTNIFDKARNVLASDSRWSFQLREGHFSHGSDRNVIPCVDNTGYDKKSAIPTPDLRGQDQNPLMNVGKSTGMPKDQSSVLVLWMSTVVVKSNSFKGEKPSVIICKQTPLFQPSMRFF